MKWPANGSLTPSARLKRRVDVWVVKLRVMPRVVRLQRMTATPLVASGASGSQSAVWDRVLRRYRGQL